LQARSRLQAISHNHYPRSEAAAEAEAEPPVEEQHQVVHAAEVARQELAVLTGRAAVAAR
jgi:hypothetical protein